MLHSVVHRPCMNREVCKLLISSKVLEKGGVYVPDLSTRIPKPVAFGH